MKKILVITTLLLLNSLPGFARTSLQKPQPNTQLNSAELAQVKQDFLNLAKLESYTYQMPAGLSTRSERWATQQIVAEIYTGWSAPIGIDTVPLQGLDSEIETLVAKLGPLTGLSLQEKRALAKSVQNLIASKKLTALSVEHQNRVGACSQISLFDYATQEILLTGSCWSE